MNENQTAPAPSLRPSAHLTSRFDRLNLNVFRTAPNRMGLQSGGPDRHGTLRHLVGGLKGFKILSCSGDRLHHDHGAFFEIALVESLSDAAFLQVKDRLLAELENFQLPDPVPTDLYAWLKVERLRDDGQLLFASADVLSDNEVNLSMVRFDLFDRGRFFERSPTGRESLNGRVELPEWLDLAFLEERLRLAFPPDTFVELEALANSPRLTHPAAKKSKAVRTLSN